MNIFFLHSNAQIAAQSQCDKHVVKMVLESTQIASSVVHRFDSVSAPWRPTHVNHPCTLWAGAALGNFMWLMLHALHLAKEYEYRYGRRHACMPVLHEISYVIDENSLRWFEARGFTNPPLCMPDEYKVEGDAVRSYRRYYLGAKRAFAKWTRRDPPRWWTENNPEIDE